MAWLGLAAAGLAGFLPGSARASAQDPPDPLVARTIAWVSSTLETLASVVCEEHYVQTLRQQRVAFGSRTAPRPVIDTTKRTLLSDYLLVRFPDARGWVPFRDVYEVDGTPVRDREDRLVQLLVAPHADRLAQAEQIREESARFNLGPGTYDINVPTFAIQFLLPELAPRFGFRRAGVVRLDGLQTTVLEYQEQAHPTVIRGAADEDVPASGRVWVTDEGRVVQTRLETRSGGKETRIDVRYGRDPRIDAHVPLEMIEYHHAAGDSLECRATYANYRRFAVSTIEQVQ